MLPFCDLVFSHNIKLWASFPAPPYGNRRHYNKNTSISKDFDNKSPYSCCSHFCLEADYHYTNIFRLYYPIHVICIIQYFVTSDIFEYPIRSFISLLSAFKYNFFVSLDFKLSISALTYMK